MRRQTSSNYHRREQKEGKNMHQIKSIQKVSMTSGWKLRQKVSADSHWQSSDQTQPFAIEMSIIPGEETQREESRDLEERVEWDVTGRVLVILIQGLNIVWAASWRTVNLQCGEQCCMDAVGGWDVSRQSHYNPGSVSALFLTRMIPTDRLISLWTGSTGRSQWEKVRYTTSPLKWGTALKAHRCRTTLRFEYFSSLVDHYTLCASQRHTNSTSTCWNWVETTTNNHDWKDVSTYTFFHQQGGTTSVSYSGETKLDCEIKEVSGA